MTQAPDFINEAYKEASRKKKRFTKNGQPLQTPQDLERGLGILGRGVLLEQLKRLNQDCRRKYV